MKMYAGVGSRETPLDVGIKMQKYAGRLAAIGYTLVSGGARKKKGAPDDVVSADHVFEYGAAKCGGHAIIYRAYCNKFIPCSENFDVVPINDKQYDSAIHFIKSHGIIPWFDKMNSWAKHLHARNVFQITPESSKNVGFVIAYSALDDKGEPMGGTRTAIKIAEKKSVKVYNLAIPMDCVMVEQHIKELEAEYGKGFEEQGKA